MVFITGSGRSGTGMLAKVFGGYHEFRVPYIEHKYLTLARSTGKNPFSSPDVNIALVLDLHQGVDPQTFIDASNLYVYLIDALWSIYPEARFILGVRNVRNFVLSAIARGWHERRPEDLMLFPEGPAHDVWEKLSAAERMGFLWAYRNGLALGAFSALPEQCWTFTRIEELHLDELERLARFARVSLSIPEAVHWRVNEGPNLPDKRAFGLTDEDEETLHRVAGPLMRRFGYTNPGD